MKLAFQVFCLLLVLCFLWLPPTAHALSSSNNSSTLKHAGFVFLRNSQLQLSSESIHSLLSSNKSDDGLVVLSETLSSALTEILARNHLEPGSVDSHKISASKSSTTWTSSLEQNRLIRDAQGHLHARLHQTYQGMPVVDAAMVMHIDQAGKVYAVNGEYVGADTVDTNVSVDCEQSFATVLLDKRYAGTDATWMTDSCLPKIVLDKYGRAHMAYERVLGYQPFTVDGAPYQEDKIYVSVVTAEVVARRPQVWGSMSLKTYSCVPSAVRSGDDVFHTDDATAPKRCKLVSRSNTTLATKDMAVNAAHNNARATFQFYKNQFGRDSLDDRGLTIVSKVHVGRNYSNAFWNGDSVNYGDGEGAFGRCG
jgi:Zn-dependent metalloprotease